MAWWRASSNCCDTSYDERKLFVYREVADEKYLDATHKYKQQKTMTFVIVMLLSLFTPSFSTLPAYLCKYKHIHSQPHKPPLDPLRARKQPLLHRPRTLFHPPNDLKPD